MSGYDRVTYCDVVECCEMCPMYGYDCDGDKRAETPTLNEKHQLSAETPTDLISRADAIEAVANAIWHYPNECYYNLNDFDMAEALAKDALKALPSADVIKFDFSKLSSGQLHDIRRHKAKASDEAKGDLISRQDAVNTIKRYKHRLQGKGQTYGFLLEEFEHQIPSAEAVQGEWIEVEDDYDNIYWECSNCEDAFVLDVGTPKDNNYNFCPNCGAKMSKGGDNE